MIAALLASLPLWAGDHTALVGAAPEAWPGLHAAAEALGGVPGRCFHAAGVCALEFPGDPPVATLSTLPGVRYAERDRRIEPSPSWLPGQVLSPPTDASGTPECPDLWELALLRAETLPYTGEGAPVIAIQDSGFLLSHVELGGRVSGQFDYGDVDTVPEVSWASGVPGHGTFIAGLIAAEPDNGLVRAGLAPHALLNLQKIADRGGAMYFSYAVAAMADLADGDLGVRVLSYSIASASPTQSFTDAVRALGDADILVVAAAANCSVPDCADANNDDHPLYPASYSDAHVVAVAGSTRDDALNPYSHYGPRTVDLAAPGVDLCSLGVGGDRDHTVAGGTSYATPLVAAAAALVWEAHPDLTAVEVARILRASALETPGLTGRVQSDGRLDVHAALDVAVPRLPQPADLSFDGWGELALQLSNPGAEGQLTLLGFHDPALVVEAPEGWQARAFAPGERLELPDAGAWTATDHGTLLLGALPAHGARALTLTLRAHEVGGFPVQLRAAASSGGADYLNAPFDEGDADPTGFLAWTFTVTATSAWQEPEDTDPAPVDSDPPDSDPPDSDPPDSDPPEGEDPTGGCGCASGSAGGGLLLSVGAALWRRRRQG